MFINNLILSCDVPHSMVMFCGLDLIFFNLDGILLVGNFLVGLENAIFVLIDPVIQHLMSMSCFGLLKGYALVGIHC